MPMMNVFMAIIPLLLLGAAFLPVAVIPASLPAAATGAAGAGAADEPMELVVRIRPEAYDLFVNGAVAGRVARAEGGDDEARRRLTSALTAIAAAHRGERDVRIVSRSSTRYREIVDVMDATRAAGLPEAALAGDGEEER